MSRLTIENLSLGQEPAGAEPCGVNRRDALKAGLTFTIGSLFVYAFQRPGDALADGQAAGTAKGSKGKALFPPGDHWYGYAVDTTKCIGCGRCVVACKLENKVPWEPEFNRTWVERYTITEDRKVIVDSPLGALKGFGPDPDTGGKKIEKSFFVPKLCNHCESSPCVQVCPVGASYMSPEGIMLVAREHCVGCGYCVQACPYGSRFLDPVHGWADKCTLCYHRITKGLAPACVESCPVGARTYGDLRAPKSAVRKLIGTSRYKVIKPELGTRPKCYYIGLDEEVR